MKRDLIYLTLIVSAIWAAHATAKAVQDGPQQIDCLLYTSVLRRHRDLARYYTRKNISISLLRAARKRDMEGVLSLYGTDEQRYW